MFKWLTGQAQPPETMLANSAYMVGGFRCTYYLCSCRPALILPFEMTRSKIYVVVLP